MTEAFSRGEAHSEHRSHLAVSQHPGGRWLISLALRLFSAALLRGKHIDSTLVQRISEIGGAQGAGRAGG